MEREIDWLDIVDSLETGKCVLFVGPYAFQNEAGQNIEQALFDYLQLAKVAQGNHKRIKRHYADDGFFFFEKKAHRDRIAAQIRKFYHQSFQPKKEMLEQIAQIPFSLIVNLTPDNFIRNAFRSEAVNLPFYHDFYDKSGEISKKYVQPSKERPLIYNLLGYMCKEESLILTHDNLFEYLKSFFAANKMHNDLLEYIQNAHAYIFLGLPIDKWYTQLLFRILKMNENIDIQSERLAAWSDDHVYQVIFQDQFGLNLEDVSASDFIASLFQECKNEGLLKSKGQGSFVETFDKDDIKNLVIKGKMEQAIATVTQVLQYYEPKSSDLLHDLHMISNQLATLKHRDIKGVISNDNSTTTKNQIVEKFLLFLEQDMMEEIRSTC